MFKKSLLFIFSIIALILLCSCEPTDNLKWKLDDSSGELKISGYGSMRDYGSSSDGFYGSSSGSSSSKAGISSSDVRSVKLNPNITSIGENAFRNYKNLKKITLSENVTSIGADAFSGCDSLEFNTYGNAKYIGSEYNPFYALICAESRSIAECEIHPDTKVIADEAFYLCDGLSSVNIPAGLTSVGEDAFNGCSSLRFTKDGNATYLSANGNPYCVLLRCVNSQSCRIDPRTEIIANSAFYGCESLRSINVPGNVRSIGNEAFYNCKHLTDVTLHGKLKQINDSSFKNCSRLDKVTYFGSPQNWDKVTVGYENDKLLDADFSFIYIHPVFAFYVITRLAAGVILLAAYMADKKKKASRAS